MRDRRVIHKMLSTRFRDWLDSEEAWAGRVTITVDKASVGLAG